MKQRFFKLAEKLSEKSDHPHHKHGSVLVRGNRILGVGFNQLKTHPRSNTAYQMLHAELSAILNSGLENFTGCDLYIVRKRKNNTLGNSFPCKNCLEMVKSLNIRRIYFSTDNSFNHEVINGSSSKI